MNPLRKKESRAVTDNSVEKDLQSRTSVIINLLSNDNYIIKEGGNKAIVDTNYIIDIFNFLDPKIFF